MANNRLLKPEEIIEAHKKKPYQQSLAEREAQDLKTLKAVGEWLQIELEKKRYTGNLKSDLKKAIEALLRGELPE
jgi:phospholipase/lecithinase/hemolysin